MKIYVYNDPIFSGSKIAGNIVRRYTRKDILDEFWWKWKTAMDNKYGPDHELTTQDNCVEDWKAVNWAWEIEVEDEG